MKISEDLSSYLVGNIEGNQQSNLTNGFEIILYLMIATYISALREQDIKLDLGGGVLDYPAKLQTTTLPDNQGFNNFLYITLFIPTNGDGSFIFSPSNLDTFSDNDAPYVMPNYW